MVAEEADVVLVVGGAEDVGGVGGEGRSDGDDAIMRGCWLRGVAVARQALIVKRVGFVGVRVVIADGKLMLVAQLMVETSSKVVGVERVG